MILRVKFNKKGYLRYISHLDMMRLFHRSFNRGQIPIAYSEGYNPHPRFSIANPLALGIESDEEYMDIELDFMEFQDFKEKMNSILPKDVQIISGQWLEKEETIDSLIAWAHYELQFKLERDHGRQEIDKIVGEWLSRDEININKVKRKGKKEIRRVENIRPLIGNLTVKDMDGQDIVFNSLLKAGSKGNLKPMNLMEALARDSELGIDMDSIDIRRTGQYAERDGKIYKPL
ncbi:MAG: TIGR03936 family radical SAM-associated protein [Tissierellaceae bacterium]